MSRAVSGKRTKLPAGNRPTLSSDDLRRLESALKRLREHLRGLLADLPVELQTASGLARALKIERTTCQRLVSAVSGPFPGPSLVGQLPGSGGLKMVLDAIAARPGAQATELRETRAAADHLDEIIREIAGSRRRLMQRLDWEGPGPGIPVEDIETREQLFTAATALTGRYSDLWFAAHLYAPLSEPGLMTQARVHGLIGHHARPTAVPLTFHVFGAEPEEPTGPEHYRPLVGADAVLRPFSSEPLPIVRSRTPGEHVVQTIETDADGPAGIDLVFGLTGRMSHPATRESQLEEVWGLVNFPVRRMLFDVFLHRDIARACIPALDHHLWRPDFATQVGERWQTRFAAAPKLELLPAGLEGAASNAYPRYVELLRTLFETSNHEPRDFVGYRCEVIFPAWRTGYRMSFDFGDSAR